MSLWRCRSAYEVGDPDMRAEFDRYLLQRQGGGHASKGDNIFNIAP